MKIKCSNCDKEINKSPTTLRRSKTGNVYCSRSCSNSKNNSLFKSGEKHPNYTTGKGSYRKRMLREVCECEDCGNTDIRVLEVHHVDRNRLNNKLENLVVLCANCHLIRHHKQRDVG